MADSFANEFRNTIRNAWCTVLEYGGNFIDALPDPIVDSSETPIARINRTLYRNFCNQEPPEPTSSFTGGQCPVFYNWGVEYDVQVPGQPGRLTGTTFGSPIRGPILSIVPQTRPDINEWGALATHSNGSGGTTTTFLTLLGGGNAGQVTDGFFTNILLGRADGQPDNCGDPPPSYPPPQPGYNDQDITITYTNNDGVDINLTGNFTFTGPSVKIDGTVTVPIQVSLEVNGPKFSAELNLNTGDITLNFGNRNYPPTNAPNPDTYRSPDDTPDNPPGVPEPVSPPSPNDSPDSSTTIIRGVLVTSTIDDNSVGVLYQDGGNPDIPLPNLGYVAFYVAIGNRGAWTSDLPVKSVRSIIECPWSGGAIAVRGTPRPGVTWTLSEVYDKAEVSKPFT